MGRLGSLNRALTITQSHVPTLRLIEIPPSRPDVAPRASSSLPQWPPGRVPWVPGGPTMDQSWTRGGPTMDQPLMPFEVCCSYFLLDKCGDEWCTNYRKVRWPGIFLAGFLVEMIPPRSFGDSQVATPNWAYRSWRCGSLPSPPFHHGISMHIKSQMWTVNLCHQNRRLTSGSTWP